MTTKTKVLAIGAATLTASLATPAVAEGFRVEAHGGWDRVQSEGVKSNGLLYGVGVGYDLNVGRKLSLGAEATADLGTTKECERSVLATADQLCARARRDLSVVGRLGYAVTPGSQLYLVAGYTNARVRADYTPASGAPVSESDNLNGVRVGGGFQQALGGGAYTKVEYRYSNYEAGTERHQVVVGVGLTF
jgi:outer membrane immunogenic protein